MNKEQENKPSYEQQEIIDHFVNKGGQLLVNAGPGSGKTMVAAHIVFGLIKEKKASPENILFISDSDAAIIELKKLNWGDQKAPNIEIKNFYSLAQGFVEEILKNRDNPMKLKLMNEKEAISFIKKFSFHSRKPYSTDTLNIAGKRIDGSWLESILFFCSLNFFKKFIPEKNHDNEMFFQWHCDISHNGVVWHPKLNHKEFKRDIEHLYSIFEDPKWRIEEGAEQWMLDELFVICLQEWEKNPPTKTYKYVVVDEFQDTDMLQYYFLKKICSENEISVSKNLCCIGDLDQAIFKYNRSLPKIFQKFYSDNEKQNLKIKKIETNRRSSKEIVDISQELIKTTLISDRFSKTLKPFRIFQSHPVLWIKNSNSEIIFQKIKQIISKERTNSSLQQDFCIGEIAILSPDWNMTLERKFLNELRDKIHEWAKEDSHFKNSPNIVQWFVKSPEITSDNASYLMLLLMQICDWQNDDDYANLSFWITEIMVLHNVSKLEETKYLEAIQEFKYLKEKDNFFVWYVGKFKETDLIHQLKFFRHDNKDFCNSLFNNTSNKLNVDIKENIKQFERRIDEYKFLDSFFKLSDQKIELIVSKIKTGLKSHQRLYKVVNNVLWDSDEYIESPDPNKIQIMPIYKSKGREFKYVFIVNLDEESFLQKNIKYRNKIWDGVFKPRVPATTFPERNLMTISQKIKDISSSMTNTKIDESERKKLRWQKNLWELHYFELEQAIRTLYIGITRAKEHLYICSPKNSPSHLIELISDHLKDDDDFL